MGDTEPRDRETIGAGGAEPEATVADLGTNGPPDTPGRAPAGEIDPGPAIGGATVAHDTAVTATGAGDATRGPADLAAATGAGATALTAADSAGSHAGAGGAGAALRAEPTFGPLPDPNAATSDGPLDGTRRAAP